MNTNVAVREARNTARRLDGASTLTRYLVPLGLLSPLPSLNELTHYL